MNNPNHPNDTVIERIMNYMEADQHGAAEILAKVCDHLEECYDWDITFDA